MKNKSVLIFIAYTLITSIILPSMGYAQDASGSNTTGGIDQLFMNVGKSLGAVANFIISIATIAGLGFGVACVFKFKQHKDNPQQVPLGQPLGLLAISVMLLWLPFLLQSLGATLTGGKAKDEKSGINATKDVPDWLKGGGGQ